MGAERARFHAQTACHTSVCLNTRYPLAKAIGEERPLLRRSSPCLGDCRDLRLSRMRSLSAAPFQTTPFQSSMGDSTPFPSSCRDRACRIAHARALRLTRARPLEDALAPGSARRRALDAALAEIEAGLKVPSLEWRREYSLLLGLERLLSEEEPHLVDGTVLSAHQVDALSGTLTALLAEAQAATATATTRNGDTSRDGQRPHGRSRGAIAATAPYDRDAGRCWTTTNELDERAPTRTRSRRTGRTRPSSTRTSIDGAARGPRRRSALLVRARHRRRQDGRRARVRRGVAHRRGADPHPSPQPRRPVHRRAARPRLPRPDPCAPLLDGRGRGQRPGHGRDLPVVRAQRRHGSPTPTRS